MKLATSLLPFIAVVVQCGAFVVQQPTTDRRVALGMAYDMVPEPEGGEEMTPKSSMPSCRMKKLEARPDIRSDIGPVSKFWLTAEADGTMIKTYRTQLLKDASKKANFPGFRKVSEMMRVKDRLVLVGQRRSALCVAHYLSLSLFISLLQGQVPPWAQPQITNFAVQETIIKTVEAAVAAFGVTSISGSDGNVEVNEDVTEMCKGYKEGNSLQFTATLNCALKETAPPVAEVREATSDVVDMADVVDVEVTPVVEE